MRTEPLRYVLSAGRTGTVFLTHFLADCLRDFVVEHEPKPTREQMMLANFRNDTGHGGALLKAWFGRCRHERLARANGNYIELNPFLCAMADLLPLSDRPLQVVMLTRDPIGWSKSMTVFKASTKLRPLIDWVPYSKPFPAPRPTAWPRMSEFEKNLSRWGWCNEKILNLKGQAKKFGVVRYEELLGPDPRRRQEAIAAIFEHLDLGPAPRATSEVFETKINPAPRSDLEFTARHIDDRTQRVAKALGYAIQVA